MSDITESYVGPIEAWVAALCEEVRELRQENDRLRLSLVGRDKAYALLNAGLESACELQTELRQEVRGLHRLDLNLRRIVAELAAASSLYQSRVISFRYRNHKGEESIRRAKFGELAYDTTEWHGEAWTVAGWDYDKKAKRTFAVDGIIEWIDQEAQP